MVSYRPFNKEYYVWQGSDFNLEEKLNEARNQVPLRTPLASLLQKALPPAPIIARHHSYRTGTNRFFDVRYASEATWPALLENPPKQADGRVIYVLPELGGDRDKLIASIREAPCDPMTLLAVPDGVDRLREAVRDLACLNWVRSHSPELESDAAARKEVDHQRADLSGYIQAQLSNLFVADVQGHNPCLWINQNKTFRITSERGLQEKLSERCDEVFAEAPEIWNELLNRRKPSSNAVRALKILLQAVLEHSDKKALGIEGTPAEYGLYASILKATGMHRQEENTWRFGPPLETKRGCVAAWNAIEGELRAAKGKRVSVRALYDLLTAPPYGVREGLIPIFLFVFYKHAEDEIAWYEENVFLADLTIAEIERSARKTFSSYHAILLQAVLEHSDKKALGIEGTPAEYGLYASILKATGMHRQEENTWRFGPPLETKRGCVAAWNAIEGELRAAKGKRVSVRALYDLLTAPPYGVREGLIPIFLFVFYKHAEDEIAWYEENVFLADLTIAEIERLLRKPDRFDVQWVEVKDARAEVLEHLAPLVGLPETTRKPLPVVLELLRNIRKLKPYVRRSANLSATAIAVRETLQRAEEPTTVLFEELPEACGVPSFLEDASEEQADVFGKRLRDALRELGGAYDALIASIDEQLKSAFGLRAPDADDRRHELAERARLLLPHATQTNLKAFLVRATDEIHDTQGWYESLAALLAKSPPAQWLDHQRDAFHMALTEVARRFRTLEPLVFDESGHVGEMETDAAHPSVQRMRLGVTSLGEPEREAVVSVHVEDQAYVDSLAENLEHLLDGSEVDSPDIKLAALGQLTRKLLAERETQLDQREVS